MKIILLSGGSGKRLWPLSNQSRSKQFLKVLKNEEGQLESMVQRVWRQLESVNLTNSTYIITSKEQVDILKNQIPESSSIIIEPERRDTFPAIALAVSYLYSKKQTPLDETICILPVDAFVDNEYFQKIKQLDTILNKSKADLALLGATPTYPSAKYGYIIREINHDNYDTNLYYKVKKFIEKPCEAEAEQLINKKALWNCGVFSFQVKFLINLLKNYKFPIQYEVLLKEYKKLPINSFDYEVVEKANNIVVSPYDGRWKDLGTWNTLTEEIESSLIGKGLINKSSINTHVINELDIPIITLGVENSVIICSPDGILVSEKEESKRLKDYITEFNQRPMYEERRWGWYKVLDFIKYKSGEEILTKKLFLKGGKNISYQLHNKRHEVWTIISGTGLFVLNDQQRQVKPGDVLIIPKGAKHAIKALEDLEFIEVQRGSELIEEDIVRFSMNWDELMKSISKEIDKELEE